MLEDIFYEIGLFVVAAIVFAIPILTTCAFIYNWDNFFKVTFIIGSMIDFCVIILAIQALKEDVDEF